MFDRYHEEFQEFYAEEMEGREWEDFSLRARFGLVSREGGGVGEDAPPSFPWEAEG